MFRCYVLMLVLFLPIVGCATPDTIGPVTHRAYDNSFDVHTIRWSGTYSGSKTLVYLKRIKEGANLRICGFYVKSEGIKEDINVEWLKYAKIIIGEEEITSTDFLSAQAQAETAVANCVVTTKVFQTNLLTEKMFIRGRKVRVLY